MESADEAALGQLVSCTHPGSKHRIFNTFHAHPKNRSFLYLFKASDCLYLSPIVFLKNPSRQMNVDIKNIYFPSSSDFHGFHLRINSVWSWFGGGSARTASYGEHQQWQSKSGWLHFLTATGCYWRWAEPDEEPLKVAVTMMKTMAPWSLSWFLPKAIAQASHSLSSSLFLWFLCGY